MTLCGLPSPQLGLMDPTGRLHQAHGRAGLSQRADLRRVQSQPLTPGLLLRAQILPHSPLRPRQAVIAAPRDQALCLRTITVASVGNALLSCTPAWLMSSPPGPPPSTPHHITHSCRLLYLPYPAACRPLRRPLTWAPPPSIHGPGFLIPRWAQLPAL